MNQTRHRDKEMKEATVYYKCWKGKMNITCKAIKSGTSMFRVYR